MYIINGIVYAGEMKEGIYVRDFRILQNLYMLVTFSTGEVRVFDAAELLQYPVYAPLRRRLFMKGAIRIVPLKLSRSLIYLLHAAFPIPADRDRCRRLRALR